MSSKNQAHGAILALAAFAAVAAMGCARTPDDLPSSARQEGTSTSPTTKRDHATSALPAPTRHEGTSTMTQDSKPIGNATMERDGTIILDLRADGPKGEVGMARFVYAPSHRDYKKILSHLGEIKPGEQKVVLPFPDSP